MTTVDLSPLDHRENIQQPIEWAACVGLMVPPGPFPAPGDGGH